jgi:hypothetical protein
VDTCLHKKRKAKTVEKGGGRRYTRQAGHVARLAAATWKVTASAKSVELPHDPINTPPVEIRTYTPLLGNSTCKTLILSVVARHSLVGRVERP